MTSERIRRQVDLHLDAAEEASSRLDRAAIKEHSETVLALDAGNQDVATLLRAAQFRLGTEPSIEPASTAAEPHGAALQMVCGRPPFVGDESVAIIGQHLNTPPVVQSWHRPECPLADATPDRHLDHPSRLRNIEALALLGHSFKR